MMYLVGIDCAKFKHDCCILDDTKQSIIQSFSFTNDREGFAELLNVLNALKPLADKIKIGFEATGHYTTNLKLFLEENEFDYMEFNPIKIHKFIQSVSVRKTKTDKVDSKHIAMYLSSVEYKPYPTKFYHIYTLRSLTRTREFLIHEKSKIITQITNVMDHLFPELKALLNNDFTSKTALYLLEHYGSAEKIKNTNIESYNKMKAELHHTINYSKFNQIRERAKSSIGHSDNYLLFELKMYLDMYHNFENQVTKIEEEILNCKILSNYITPKLKGIGALSGAAIIAEIGNFNNFNTAQQLLAFAGIDPGIRQSGDSIHSKGKMVKHGSAHLRMHIMNCAKTFMLHNPAINEYYWKKKNEGKYEYVALSHVARKLITIIFALETNKNKIYDISKIR